MKIAFIPARGGSKGVPLKNIHPVNNKPLIQYSIEALLDSDVDDIWVATDSEKIMSTVLNINQDNVSIFIRNEENAKDTSSTESVILEFLEKYKYPDDTVFMLIQCTNPFIKKDDIDEALAFYENNNFSSVISVVPFHRFLWQKGQPVNYDYKDRKRKQDFKNTIYMENGAFYINKVGNILRDKNRLTEPIGMYIMPEHCGLEIDFPIDLKIAESILNNI